MYVLGEWQGALTCVMVHVPTSPVPLLFTSLVPLLFTGFVVSADNAYVGFESVMYPGQRLGILPDGNVKDPAKTFTGKCGRYIPIIISGVSVTGWR